MRQAVRDWHQGKHGTAVKGFFKREWPVIAFILCFGAIAFGILRVESFADDLRDGVVGGCERQNEVRAALRQQITVDIENALTTPPKLFPEIPRDEFQALINERVKELRAERAAITDADCEAAYPD